MKKSFSTVLSTLIIAITLVGCSSEKKVTIKSAADLKGLVIGVQKGSTSETWVSENLSPTKDEMKSYITPIDASIQLKNGKLDAVILDILPAKAIVAENPELKMLDVSFAEAEQYAIAVKKGNPELLATINKTIARMKEDGSYDALTEAFMPAAGDSAIVVPPTIETTGEVIKLGTEAGFKPFEYYDGPKIVGFDVSLAENVAKDYGRKLDVSVMAFDALIPALQAGAIDFAAAGMTVTEERKKMIDFSDPYFEATLVIIVKK